MDTHDARDGAPHVLIVGGLLTPPIGYRRVRRRILDHGAAHVDIAPVSALDWARAGVRGFVPLQRKVAASIARTRARADRPIMVVGHSGGGLLARLAMSDAPYRGHVGGAAPMVGCLVSLGSPHDLHHAPLARSHEGVRLAAFLAEHQPGAHHPGTAYVTVASDAVPAHTSGARSRRGPVARLQRAFFRRITGPTLPPGSDGIVSRSHAHLAGAHVVDLHDVYHGVTGNPWYGDDAVIDEWWPVALLAWQDAIGRSAGDGPQVGDADAFGDAG